MPINFSRLAIAGACVAALGACASTPPPHQELTRSSATIEAAERSGAGELAAAELASARAKLGHAQTALAAGRNAEAKRLADEAAVEAELAQARAATTRARTAAQQVDQSIRALREEIERKPPNSTGVLGMPPAVR